MPRWYMYILRCGDGTLYTGIATDVARRLREHQRGIGAKYTRGRGPIRLAFSEKHPDRSTASKRENQLHRWSRKQKMALIKKGG